MTDNEKDIQEITELCSRVFIAWTMRDSNPVEHNMKLLGELFTPRVLLKKFEAFDIDIGLPDDLLCLIAICCNENPAQAQLILKELLLSIKKRIGPIPKGYVITPEDFSLSFPFQFPIMSIPEQNAKYESLWIGQKIEREKGKLCSDKLCDTVEWWKEVME